MRPEPPEATADRAIFPVAAEVRCVSPAARRVELTDEDIQAPVISVCTAAACHCMWPQHLIEPVAVLLRISFIVCKGLQGAPLNWSGFELSGSRRRGSRFL